VFAQGRDPALVLSRTSLRDLRRALVARGYTRHRLGLARTGEIEAWRRILDAGFQIHVQIVDAGYGEVGVFAHAEPETERLVAHLVSAVTDAASFRRGARVLLADLRAAGFFDQER
jgi:hypothetical protein